MTLKRTGGILVGILAVVGSLALLAAFGFALSGVSAQPEPSALEAKLARAARHRLIPRAARARENPATASDELIEEGLEHWADHCAICHGNDGKGDTAIGRGLYPRSPDMTLPATQELSDGELFWIIENGIKLTGMPAWGSPSAGEEDEDSESWGLVHFIRALPRLTADDLQRMKRFNPVNAEEFEKQREIDDFLSGGAESDHSEGMKPRSEGKGHQH